MTILDKREVSLAQVGPRGMKDPRSKERAIQTLYSLKLVASMAKADIERLRRDLDEIEQYEQWAILGYPNLDAMLEAETVELPPIARENIAQARLGTHGGDRRSEAVKDQGVNHTLVPRGSGRKAYTVARLRRDHPELAEAVEAGKLSANAAAVQAGFRRATWTAPVDPEELAKALERRYPGWTFRRREGAQQHRAGGGQGECSGTTSNRHSRRGLGRRTDLPNVLRGA